MRSNAVFNQSDCQADRFGQGGQERAKVSVVATPRMEVEHCPKVKLAEASPKAKFVVLGLCLLSTELRPEHSGIARPPNWHAP
jgi:hypothetical protein